MPFPGASDYQLSPWDQAPFFTQPRETEYLQPTTGMTVAQASPSRIAIIFSAPGAGPCNVSLKKGMLSTDGITISPGAFPVILLHSEVGNLVQQEWFGSGPGAGSVLCVIEVFLSKWPGEG